MTVRRIKCLFGISIVVALALAPSVAPAQLEMLGAAMMNADQPAQTVAGTGMATVSRRPDRLRVHIPISAKGATLEEALTQLKTRREAAVAKLEQLGADTASVRTGPPTVAEGQSEQRRRMEQMIIPQLRARGQQIPPGLIAPQLAAVSMMLVVEWPLDAVSAEDVLLKAAAVRTQIKDADLSGKANDEEMSPEARELAEEMADMSYDDDSPVQEGEPLFLYVARVSEAECQKAAADAFAKARKQAESLALAAGIELGAIVSLAGHGSGDSGGMDDIDYLDYEHRRHIRRIVVDASPGEESEQDGQEVTSVLPGGLSYKVMVRALFGVAPTK